MLKVGDIFKHGELSYKVIGKDAQGRAISTLCADEEVKNEEPQKTEDTANSEPQESEEPKSRGRNKK